MPKRKYPKLSTNTVTTRHENIQAERLAQKFENGAVSISRALKTARGFERQKLGRREQTAKAKPKDNNEKEQERTLARLGDEIVLLKVRRCFVSPDNSEGIDANIMHPAQNLDLHETAQRHLYRHLDKTKRIAESPVYQQFKESIQANIPKISRGPGSAAEANVTARLFKSNPVRNVIPFIVAEVRNFLGVDQDRGSGEHYEERKKKVKQTRDSALEFSSNSNSGSGSDGNVKEDVDGDANANANANDYVQLDSCVTASSSSPDEENDDDDDDDEGRRQPFRPEKPKTKEKELPKTTTFLPSLLMGGYWSGSESDDREGEDKGKPVRKNRMGQQARRALWEKKYGARANHLQKQTKSKKKGKDSDPRDSRDSGWDTKRGATNPDDDVVASARRRRGQTRPDAKREGNHNVANGNLSGSKKKMDDKPLHPSWEAARRAKQHGNEVAFQGKKITFD